MPLRYGPRVTCLPGLLSELRCGFREFTSRQHCTSTEYTTYRIRSKSRRARHAYESRVRKRTQRRVDRKSYSGPKIQERSPACCRRCTSTVRKIYRTRSRSLWGRRAGCLCCTSTVRKVCRTRSRSLWGRQIYCRHCTSTGRRVSRKRSKSH